MDKLAEVYEQQQPNCNIFVCRTKGNISISTEPFEEIELKYFNMDNINNFTGEDIICVTVYDNDNTKKLSFPVSIEKGKYDIERFIKEVTESLNREARKKLNHDISFNLVYDSTTKFIQYNLETPLEGIKISLNSCNDRNKYLTGLPYLNNYNFIPCRAKPNLDKYHLLIRLINLDASLNATLNNKRYSFIVPFKISDEYITYSSKNSLENVTKLRNQLFNYVEVSLSCIEFDPIFENVTNFVMKLDFVNKNKTQKHVCNIH